MKGKKRFSWVYIKASKFEKMWLMSWPKLDDYWRTLLILTQTLKGSRRW
jgi:hypothetical protein